MSKPNAGNESAEMDFWSHFAALRPHLVRGAAAVVVIAVAAFFARHFLIDVVLFGPKSAGFPTNRLLLETGHGLAALCGWINALTGLSLSVNPEAFDVSNLDFRVINTAMAGQFNLHMKISPPRTASYSGSRPASSRACSSAISSSCRSRSASSSITKPALRS